MNKILTAKQIKWEWINSLAAKTLYYIYVIKLFKLKIMKMKKYTLTLIGSVLLLAALTSCSGRKGYGCRGNYSWDRMMYKNTRQ